MILQSCPLEPSKLKSKKEIVSVESIKAKGSH